MFHLVSRVSDHHFSNSFADFLLQRHLKSTGSYISIGRKEGREREKGRERKKVGIGGMGERREKK